MTARIFLLFVAALALGLAPRSSAQCFGDDGFNIGGVCCTAVQPTLPAFPGIQLPSAGVCFLNCNVEQQWNCVIQVTPPIQVFDDLYVATLSVASAQTTIAPTLLVMQYQRTWMEFPVPGALPRQVWRFLVNCDANYVVTTASSFPCPNPPCATAGISQHFIGHIDYAHDCFPSTWQTAVSLTHLCGNYMHAPFSQFPLGGPQAHNERTYAFAGPAPVAFGPTAPIAGPIIAESARSHFFVPFLPLFWASMSEMPIVGGAINPVNQGCPCVGPPTPLPAPLWTDYTMNFASGCAGFVNPFTPVPIGGLIPTGMMSMSIGTHLTAPGTFYSGRSVQIWLGVATETDPCPSPVFSSNLHVVTGVSTKGGPVSVTFPDSAGLNVAADTFLDLENMLVFNPSATPSFNIGIGGIFLSPRVWNLNVP